jgi:hypothetical protein
MRASAESSTASAAHGGSGAEAAPHPFTMPDFFIVGHAKCGTTALYRMLRGHPQIFMPEMKEPLYFAGDLQARFQRGTGPALPSSPEEYSALFAGALPGQRVGEASSSYLWSAVAAKRIAELRPDARIIAILREPASFLRSLHLQLLQSHIETEKDLRRAIELEGARREGRHIPRRSPRPQALLYSERVRYVEQLRRYHAVFPAEQVLVLIYDDFRRENEATVRRVLHFLGVEETVPIALADANPTVRMRSQQLDDLVTAVSVGHGPLSRAVKRTVKTLTPKRVRSGALELARSRVVYGEERPADEGIMRDLRSRYEPEVRALGDYLGRDLAALWGYDDLG